MNRIPNNPCLRFGIPSLDDLFGTLSLSSRAYGIPLGQDEVSRMALMGPPGAGKSILALHLISRYAADAFSRFANSEMHVRAKGEGSPAIPRIVYLSTDLTYQKAHSMWESFRLDRPNLREVPFYSGSQPAGESHAVPADDVSLKVDLELTDPLGDSQKSLSAFLLNAEKGPLQIAFIDLIRNSAGDLWSLCHRLVTSLRENSPDRHLVIVDNIDGFEALVGELNAFGQRSSTRSRIMQTFEVASKKSHVLFVSEDEGTGSTVLSDVCDVVIRLNTLDETGYRLRSLEVLKARAQPIHRGNHNLIIRTGGGSTTGSQENADDPRTANAYVQVIPSFSTISRRIMNEPQEAVGEARLAGRAGFGIPALDEMCCESTECSPGAVGPLEVDSLGLHRGKITAILGDPNTYKTPLAHKFARHSFELFAKNVAKLCDPDTKKREYATNKALEALALAKAPRASASGKAAADPRADESRIQSIAEKLHSERRGEEELWTVEAIREEIKESLKNGKLTGAMTLVLAEQRKTSLRKQLKDMLNREDWEEVDWDRLDRTLPAEVLKNTLYESIREAARRKCKLDVGKADVAKTLFHVWWHDFCRGSSNRKEAEGRLKLRRDFEEGLEAKARLAASVSQLDEIKAEGSLISWKKEVLGKDLGAVIDSFLRGGTAYLSKKDRNSLDGDEPVEQSNLRKILIGVSTFGIEAEFERFRSDAKKLDEWLRPIDEKYGKLTTTVSIESFEEALPDKDAQRKDNLDAVGPLSLTEALPQLWTRDRCDNLSLTGFARFVMNISPRTHPFAFESGAVALAKELQESLQEKEAPVFCSAIVAAGLQLARMGRLSIQGHQDDELTARHKATETVSALRSWLNNHVDRKSGLAAAAEKFIAMAQGAKEEKEKEKAGCEFTREFAKFCDLYVEKVDSKELVDYLRVAVLLMEEAVRWGLVEGTVVLISTDPTTSVDSLWADHSKWLDEYLTKELEWEASHRKQLKKRLENHMRVWLSVRRLEVHFLSASTLAQIMRRNVAAAQHLLFEHERFTTAVEPQQEDWERRISIRQERSSGVRFVLDGLGSLRQAYPNVTADPLFLAWLKLHLERERFTALVVGSQPGRPDAEETDPFLRDCLNFFLNQIRTWRVLFFGSIGVAITHLPSSGDAQGAVIRELKRGHDGEMEINSHYELYRGLETGQPLPVPLEIRLVGANPGFQKYTDALNELFNGLFPASEGHSAVVRAESGADWTTRIKDFGRLHRDTRLNHSLLLQVDEYWSFGRSEALRRQGPYLRAQCRSEGGGHDNDGLEIFQSTLADPPWLRFPTREERFFWNGYLQTAITREPAREQSIDRIPFTWDFGFLLCDRDAWKAAKDEPLINLAHSMKAAKEDGEAAKVGDVWKAIPNILDTKRPASESSGWRRPRNSWRMFLEAAVTVATHRAMSDSEGGPAFDMEIRGGESLMCLILEIWASEVYLKYSKSGDLRKWFFGRFTKRSWVPCPTRGLIGLMAEPPARGSLTRIFSKALCHGRLPNLYRHSMELFKSFLLLREALSLPDYADPDDPFMLRPRQVNPKAVAARHWYTTAADFMSAERDRDRFLPVRLPGNFSVRGDWFLAVAKGSYSNLLADRALDLLSSRRGNVDRLHKGLGLPVRDLGDLETGANPRTALTVVRRDGRREWIRYRSLAKLGSDATNSDFHWLWRSTLGDYDAQNRVFHQGIALILNWWRQLSNVRTTAWSGGFELYDAITRYYELDDTSDQDGSRRREIFDRFFAVNSIWEFAEICDDLIDRLRRATPRR